MASGDDYQPDDPDEFPEEQLGPDEAPTPDWLPLLGIGIALLALFSWLVTRPTNKTAEELAASSAAPSSSAAPAAE